MSNHRSPTNGAFKRELSAFSDLFSELNAFAAEFAVAITRLNGIHKEVAATIGANTESEGGAAKITVPPCKEEGVRGRPEDELESHCSSPSFVSDFDHGAIPPQRQSSPATPSPPSADRGSKPGFDSDVSCPGVVLIGADERLTAASTLSHSSFKPAKSTLTTVPTVSRKLSAASSLSSTSFKPSKTGVRRNSSQFGQVRLRNQWCDVDPELFNVVASSSRWEIQQHKRLSSRPSFMSNAPLELAFVMPKTNSWLFRVAHPGGFARLAWNALCLALITWDILIIPMQAFPSAEHPVVFYLEWVSTIIWTFDMLFNFRTGHFIGARLEMRPRVIARRYVSTWFTLDLLLVVSEWVGRFTPLFASASLLRTSRVLRTLRFVKLVRLAKMQNLWVHVKEQINSNTIQLVFNMTLMTLALMICVHIIACMWYALGEREHDGWTSYEGYDGYKGTGFWYLASARWVIAQVNGRTDIDDRRNIFERGFACAVGIVMAVIAKAIFTSVMTKTMLELSQLTSEKTRRRRLVNAYLETHQLSTTLMTSVKRHLNEYQDPNIEHTKESQVLAILPRHVRGELLLEVRGPRLTKHPLFSEMSLRNSGCVRHICQNAVLLLSPLTDEVVFDKSDPCSRMLFVDKGTLTYGDPKMENAIDNNGKGDVSPSRKVAFANESAPLLPGDWVSEPALWIEWVNCGRLVSDDYACVYSVPANDLAATLKEDSGGYTMTVLYARSFIQQLDALEKWSDIISFEIRNVPLNGPRINDVQVTIASATGLLPADAGIEGSKADPYCVCHWEDGEKPTNDTQIKTKVVRKTLGPVWNQTGCLRYSTADSPLIFEVWDKDTFSQDDLMGVAKIEACQFQEFGFDGDIRLVGPKADGYLRVKILVIASPASVVPVQSLD